jgi:hypothetical protein
LHEENRIRLNDPETSKDFLDKLMGCFEYEDKNEYILKYKASRINVVEYFEKIKYFIAHNKKWKVKDWDGFSNMLVDMCATIDVNEDSTSNDIEHLKCIAECVKEEVEGFKTVYESYALVSFIAMQTVMHKRNKSGELKELCNRFLKGKMESKEKSYMMRKLKEDFKRQIGNQKKVSVFEKAYKLMSKMTETELEEILRETQNIKE